MQLLSHHSRTNYQPKSSQKPSGFTIVELLIIIPIVVIIAGVFIGAIITMTGDVLAGRASNMLSYDIQDALKQIEQDVSLSGGFLATNNFDPVTPQGSNNDTTKFKNANATNPALILNIYATTSSPLNYSRKLAYISSQPNQCNSSQVDNNSSLMMNVVYFVKDGTLWRRVIAPNGYSKISCNTPWQQPTCKIDYNPATDTFCKAKDTKLVEGISNNGLVINYFTNPSSSTPDPDAGNVSKTDTERQTALISTNTIGVSISATTTTAGRDISQAGSIRATSPNNNIVATTITSASICSDLPGFIVVPGSITYGTKDFCVMKYEAKADDDSDSIGDTTCNTTKNTWPNDSCPISSSIKLVSSAAGYPVANITQSAAVTDASSFTANCSSGCHILTEAEWMTIAQNVLSVASNWTDGGGTIHQVGTGYIYSGHNDNSPSTASEADSNDANGYTGTGNSSPSNQRRTLTLTNGEVIWDMAGNVWEWTQGTIASGMQPGIPSGGYDFREWTNSSLLQNGLSSNSMPGYTGVSEASSWNSTQGIGIIYSNYDEASARVFRRSGAWNDQTKAGIMALSMNMSSSTAGENATGLRVAR
jgi:type II secretory pathway pseudopilin PulG/formylglycine-generating enzyme required for sulfatase activity